MWDGSSAEFEADRFSLSSHAANKDAALKLANLLYSEKYSVQQFLGSFGNLVTDDGNRHYTVDEDKYTKAMGDNLFPGLACRFSGWIPDGVTIKGDVGGDALFEASKVYEEQRSHFDPVKDYIPDYVNPDAATVLRWPVTMPRFPMLLCRRLLLGCPRVVLTRSGMRIASSSTVLVCRRT
ncbi:hypothetical protein [Bifidobacterium longum]|uniref:hypothetical protein n=1 Tax=Bifidobacterium longum TaxID=216816 RepID=UPI001D0D6E50|nr:hypothetical protein [Bifidobacterium longum]